MNAFFSVVMCYRIQNFQHLAIRFCGLGALENPNRECVGVLIMPKRPGCYKHNNAALVHLPVSLHLRTTNPIGPDSIMRSEHAQQRRIERRHNKHERMKRRLV